MERALNGAENEVAYTSRQLLRNSAGIVPSVGIRNSETLLKDLSEEFLEKCYQDDKDPDFEAFAVQFCNEVNPGTGCIFRDIFWPEEQHNKPVKRTWLKDKER